MSQAEHDRLASAILLTTSSDIARQTAKEIDKQIKLLERQEIIADSLDSFGEIIVCDSLEQAIDFANELAPEHLEMCVEEPLKYIGMLDNAGSVFLGNYSPEPLGDYYAGPNHVLPTSGTARFFSPLSVDSFIKKSSFIYYTEEELSRLVAESPYHLATAADIDWLEKVRMQGAIQKWVDHSISVTINLPENVSESLVNDLYVEAWRCGCKGCTVYREGSRTGVLVALEKKEEKNENAASPEELIAQSEHPHKRPAELECDVVRFQNNKEKWIAFVGLPDGRPYEIFTGLADDEDGIFCPKSVTKGKIVKTVDAAGNKRYDFEFINKRGYRTVIPGLSDKFNPEYWNYAKLISGVLRYGMPIDQVIKLVNGLELDSQSINTWKMGVERALKKYMPNGAKASGQRCPNCGGETLIYQEGCLICTSCGTSKCG